MRILHVIASLDPAGGGPPAVATRLAAAQARLGHDVALASTAHVDSTERVAQSLQGIPAIDRTRQVDVSAPAGLRRLLVMGQPDTTLLAEIKNAEFVHLHGLWEPLLHWAAHTAHRRKVPYAITPHGMLDPWSLAQKRWKKRLAMALGYRRMLDQAAFIHALNTDEARLIEPLKLATPVRIIPNGVFLEEIEPLPERGSFYQRHPEFQGQPFVLFLSRLHYKKGLDYLAEAFALVAKAQPNIRLVVAGPDGGAQADFEQRIAEAGLTGRVHLVGPIYGREKYEALVDAAYFCLPSRQEGFSMAILEALACGTPVVISENCHFPEVAEVGAGEVVPLNADAVAGGLLRVLSDAQRAMTMGQAGRKLVETKYTWPVIGQKFVEAYEKVMA